MHDKQIRRRRAVLALLVVISLILLTDYFGESSGSPLHSVQRGIATVLSPVQDGASKVLSPVRDVAGWLSSTVSAKSRVTELTKENDQLRGELALDQYAVEKEKQLAGMLKLDQSLNLQNYGLEAANVTGKDSALFYETITVDQGSDAGVKLDDPVVGPGGLVGDVTQVMSDESIVTLLTAPKFAVGAMVENNLGASGLIQPQVGDPSALVLDDLPTDANVSSNQLVVTSGFGYGSGSKVRSFYPPGIPIGTVSSSNPQSSVLENQEVQVTPLVDLAHLSAVQILTRPYSGS